MEKKFTKFELARMRRTAQNVDQFIQRKNKLEAKKAEIQAELDSVNQLIELTDAPTRAMTGGFGTEDIIKKVVTVSDKLDKNGNVVKTTTYEFLYPDTIVPPAKSFAQEEPNYENTESEVEAAQEEPYCGNTDDKTDDKTDDEAAAEISAETSY